MPLSISSSDPAAAWRRFFRTAAWTAAIAVGALYAFVVLVDPWGSLPLTLPLDRVPVTSNQRFAYPVLARSSGFDSAIFGTSTSRLLRPADLNPAFDARFANLAMNDATPYEISALLGVFNRAHREVKFVMLGVDARWCVTGDSFQKLTPRPFPAWMYGANRWRGYAEMFNLFAIQEAGKAFAVMTGLKKPDMGRDGYTSFVPPDMTYDPARAATHLVNAAQIIPGGDRTGTPDMWRFPALDLLRRDLAMLPAGSHKMLFFTPYNYRVLAAPGSEGALVWDECKRRVAALVREAPNVSVVDFMRPSPITNVDDNYWDPQHYRVGVANRMAKDLIAADRGETLPDFQLLPEDRRR